MRRFGSRMGRECVEDDDAIVVRFVGDEGSIPPTVGGCFNECAHIVVASIAVKSDATKMA